MLDYSQRPHFFGRRRGKKLRRCAEDLIENLLPRLQITLPDAGVPLPLISNPKDLFNKEVQEVWLEVGFGSGEHAIEQIKLHQNIGLIACEPYMNGVATLLGQLHHKEYYDQIRIVSDDVRLLFPALPDSCLGRVFVLFPDPWPKIRHAKRRFIGPDNLPILARLMAKNAELRIASDDPIYQTWVDESLENHPDFFPKLITNNRNELPTDWATTRYEQKAIAGAPKFYIFSRK